MRNGVSSKNRKILDKLHSTQKAPFVAADVNEVLKLSLKETSRLLTYFARRGWVSRVKRGLYILVPLGVSDPEKYTENPWVIAQRVFSPCYIGGFSAAEYWELTDQIFHGVVVITTHKQRRQRVWIKETEFLVKVVNKKYFGRTKTAWVDNVRVLVSDPIQTIIDILDDPHLGGGIRNVSDMVREYFSSQYRNDDEMIGYIEAKNNKTIYKRLGYLIERFNIVALDLKEICKKNISAGFTLLDPTVKGVGSFDSYWNLKINVNIER
jgi:predicted transcriptional regulator of viral defense system